jgi:hypothetical protein
MARVADLLKQKEKKKKKKSGGARPHDSTGVGPPWRSQQYKRAAMGFYQGPRGCSPTPVSACLVLQHFENWLTTAAHAHAFA